MEDRGAVDPIVTWAGDLERRHRARAARLRTALPDAASTLRSFGARRVILFGSLARGEATESSDVDLLVDGIPLDRIFQAEAAIAHLFDDAEVDLVPAERARPEILARAALEGEVLLDDA